MFIINDVYNLFWLQTFRLDLGYVVHIVLLAGFQPVKKNNPRGVVFLNSLILREKNKVYDVPLRKIDLVVPSMENVQHFLKVAILS